MAEIIRRNLQVIVVAMITAAITAGAPAIAHGVQHALFAHNSDKVDGKHAVASGASVANRKGKLVATSSGSGRLPNNIISKAPNSNKLDGIDSTAFGRLAYTEAENIFTITATQGEQVVSSVTITVPGSASQLVEVTGNFTVWDFNNPECATPCEVDYYLAEQGTANDPEKVSFLFIDSANGSGGTATATTAFTAAPGTHTYELRARSFGNATDAMNVDSARMTAKTVAFDESGGAPSPLRTKSSRAPSKPASRR